MLVLLLLHLLAALLAPLLVRWWGPRAFYPLALVPAAAFGWALTRTADGAATAARSSRRTLGPVSSTSTWRCG